MSYDSKHGIRVVVQPLKDGSGGHVMCQACEMRGTFGQGLAHVVANQYEVRD